MTKDNRLQASARMMRAIGWLTLVGLPAMLFIWPAGFLWGTHPDSPHEPWSPYLFMLVAMYVGWGILMITSARDPERNAVIVTYGILANLLHGLVMLVQSFVLPHEMQHLGGDVLLLFVLVGAMWYWHPSRVPARTP